MFPTAIQKLNADCGQPTWAEEGESEHLVLCPRSQTKVNIGNKLKCFIFHVPCHRHMSGQGGRGKLLTNSEKGIIYRNGEGNLILVILQKVPDVQRQYHHRNF